MPPYMKKKTSAEGMMWVEQKVTVTNPEGLHARPARDLLVIAHKFASEIRIVKGDRVAVFTAKGEGVALGLSELSSDQMMEQNQGIAVTPDRILMPTGTYPKGWKTAAARGGS